MGVSVLIPARNEEKNLAKCLRTVAWIAGTVWILFLRNRSTCDSDANAAALRSTIYRRKHRRLG